MGKKDFVKGMEAGAKPFERKFEELSENTRKIGEKIEKKLDGLGDIMDMVIDDLSDMQKKELYNLNTPYDLKEDLDDDEKEILAALLLKLSGLTKNNEFQKKFIRSVNAYIEVKAPQAGLDISCIENIENISSQKIIMQTVMEYLYLASEDFSFLEELEEEVFEHFSVNRKGIREIEGYIQAVSNAVGKEGIAEKYGFVPEEKEEPGKIDQETFRLYKEATPYDLLEDLSGKEAAQLGALLSALAEEAEPNGLQLRYIEIMKSEAELDMDAAKGKEPEIDDMGMDAQKIILQVAMEYGFLGNSDYAFMESEWFDDFSVNKRGIRQIKDAIQRVCDEKGPKGIIEKYYYMGVDEDVYYKGTKAATKTRETQFPEYDGSDISEACADQVNVHHHYIVLEDYLVYCDEQFFGKTRLYCVHKKTGEKREIPVEIQKKDEIKACNLCGCGEYVYLLHDSGIYKAHVAGKEPRFQKMNMDISMKRAHSGNFFPQCSERYLVFLGGKEIGGESEKRILYVVDLETMASREILPAEGEYKEFEGFRLTGDMIFANANEESYYIYKYDLATGEKTQVTKLTSSNFECLKPCECHNDTTGQYGKYIFCSTDNEMNNEKYLREDCFYDCIDLESGNMSSVILQGVVNAATFPAYHYIYFLLKDSSIGRYDILTGKKQTLMTGTKAVHYHEEGLFKKTLVPMIDKMSLQLQVVGKWIYYKEFFGETIHKLEMDGETCQEKPFSL